MADEGNERAGGAPRPAHVRAVSGDTAPITIAPAHLADLRSSGLDDETIARAGLYSESRAAPIAEILGWGWRQGGGLVFPFHDYDSRKVLLRRVKPDRPRYRSRNGKRKPIKYEQPPNTPAHPFIGPHTIHEQRLDAAGVVAWGEGEKKGLLLDQLGFASIALTGCHNFNDSDALKNGDGLKWSKALEKYAQRFVRGKRHLLVPDSDFFTNPNVMLAGRRLAGLLLDGGATSVSLVCVPGGEDGVGIDDYFAEHGEEATRALLSSAVPIAPGEEVSPIAPRDPLVKLASLAWLRAAKLDPDLRLPPRFDVRRDRSLWVEPPGDEPGDHKEVMRSVLMPVRLLSSIDGTEHRVEIAWFARGAWHRAIVDRRACKDARRALAELPPDSAITSNNAAAVVGWLDEYVRHNEERLRAARFVSEFGWQSDRCFMLSDPIGGDGSVVADESGDRGAMIEALRPRGSAAAHLDALRRAFGEDPIAALAILAALCAPLLRKLGAPNFGFNLYGDSSTGKTSMIKIAASVFGDPSSEQWVASWNATAVALELRAATFTDLPLILDEVGASDARSLSRVVYMLVNGVGKSRGDRSLSVRRTLSWHSPTLSSGEHEVIDDHANTGAQVRMLQYRVGGFGSLDAAGVDALREACEQNHGHAGRAWVESLVAIEDWRPYVDLFVEAKRQFRERASGALLQRQAVFFALLAVTEHLAHGAIGLGRAGGASVREFFEQRAHLRAVQTAGDRGLESVSQWIASEPDAFPDLEPDPSGALVCDTPRGVRRIAGVRHAGRIYLLPAELRARLDADGLSMPEVIASWVGRGWIEADQGRQDTRRTWNSKRTRVVSIACAALGIDPV